MTNPAALPALPTSRQLVRGGLDLGNEAARRLRGASIYVAMVTLCLIGPLAVALIVIVDADPELIPFEALIDPYADPFADPTADPIVDDAGAAALGLVSLGAFVAFAGVIAMAVESQALAAAILAGVALGRPVSTREALRRSRQVFWRLVGYALITAIPISIVVQIVSAPLGALLGDAIETTALLTTVLAAVLGLPFVYGVTAIVLGEVGSVEAARRSVMLVRARWRLAIVIAAVATAAAYLGVFAYLGALGVIATFAAPLGVGVSNGPLALLVLVGLALALSAAFGSLLLTITAIVVAPQVIAFLGLTHYSAGLDRARDANVLRPAERFISVPLVIGLALVLVCALAAIGAAFRG